MASIRKKNNSAIWFACYRLATGKTNPTGRPIWRRVQRSTGTTDPERALAMAQALDRAAEATAARLWSKAAKRKFTAELDAIARGEVTVRASSTRCAANAPSAPTAQAEFPFSAPAESSSPDPSL